MDHAYEGNETLRLVGGLGMTPVAPQKANRKTEWDCDRGTRKRRNGIKRQLFRFNGRRRIFARLEWLDIICFASIHFTPVVKMIKR